MIQIILDKLKEAGWLIEKLDENQQWALNYSTQRGLIFIDLQSFSQGFSPPLEKQPEIRTWEVIIFCPNGIDSMGLKQKKIKGIQFWFLDMQTGNVFPYPPTRNNSTIKWLSQIVSGNAPDHLPENISFNQKYQANYISYTLIVLNLLFFLVLTAAGGSQNQDVLIRYGAKVNDLINSGEYWRFLTSIFIHIGIIHLIFNLYALWVLGPFAEMRFGHMRFLALYLVSGICASIASYLFSTAISAGASGAIFGIMGGLLYYSWKQPELWQTGFGKNLLVVIAVNLGFGFIQPGIDNYAHIGGLITGFTFMGLLKIKKKFEDSYF
ncbi:MAG: rhomboid family intramembrane serine protease [Desulfitobacteriaceae bacterium]